MIRITAIHQTTGTEAVYDLYYANIGLEIVGRDARDQQLAWLPMQWWWRRWNRWRYRQRGFTGSAKQPLLVIGHNGANPTVTWYGGAEHPYLADQPLIAQQRWLWLANQELRYGNFVFFWEAKLQWMQPLRGEYLWRVLIILLLVGLLGSFGILALAYQRLQEKIITNGQVAFVPPAPATATITATLTLTATPRPTRGTPLTAMPIPTVVRQADGRDLANTPTATPTSTALPPDATIAAARATCADSQPIPPSALLRALGVTFQPACVKLDEWYWRITNVKWLDAEAAQRRHHIYVFLQSDQPLNDKMVMWWENGSCIQKIKDNSGANCPMYATGPSYRVWMQGAPSEQVHNLGLGEPDDPDGYRSLTSFEITFTKTLREKP